MTQRSIQDIVPPARNKPLRQSAPPPQREQNEEETHHHRRSQGVNSSMFVWIALVFAALVAGIIAIMTFFFHSAEASVTVLEWKSDVSGAYSAGTGTDLSFEHVTVTEKAEKVVPATGMVEAQDRAVGTIIISNLHSTKSQRLITSTRFETPAKLVYKIHAPVTVPGYTMKGGQKVAGTVEVQVYAELPGDKYNAESAEFKLPGLEKSDQYTTITAKTKTPLTGGFVGKRATVEKSVRDQALSEIKADLERTLRERVSERAPQGSVVFPESVQLVYLEAPDAGTGGNEATISVEGTAKAPAFPKDALSRALATRAAISSDAVLALQNPNDISFALGEGVASAEGFTFTLTGSAHLRAEFDALEFSEKLAGKTREQSEAVRVEYQALTGPLGLQVRPFWLSSLPKNPERITVTVRGALDQ